MSVGKTKDVGWEIGVSRTIPYPIEQVWDLLTSLDGTAIWLGADVKIGAAGEHYETADGTVGEVRSFHPHSRLRLTCRPAGWDHETTVQVTVTAAGGRTTLRFHQERLTDAAERERQRTHWRSVLDAIVEAL